MRTVLLWFTLLIGSLLIAIRPAIAGEVHVAVASNFATTLAGLSPLFEQTSGHSLTISAASSGKLFAQIRHGAPFDVLLSADEDKPRRLAEQFPDTAQTLMTYAIGKLALWHPKHSVYSLTDLVDLLALDDSADIIAVANPRLAPYGLATRHTLAALSISPKRTVMGENISQTYRFIESGNAPLGFIALSQAIATGLPDTQYFQIPETYHPPIRQDAILTLKGVSNPAAQAFLHFLTTPEAQARIRQQGYDTPHD
ncbi:molybdate ABC transporter substrate-binding protein [Thalassolituus sp.]|uniref:molybdate ABC transporter substrate-binding protein n=1 Tax=Thalassolituus sp. TaxID=2030822 RepID=UPI0035170A81